ncbi:MAG TPA: FAD-linked oxidase C-terminal domain-containing protein, partial [Leifsonia sp.]|nr:FAD-linked oxidase C-terminal domain-containing protein [Leifsonia sp.]
RDPDATDELRALRVTDHAALLVEFQEETGDALAARLADAPRVFDRLTLTEPAELSSDAARRAQLWRLRKGLYTLVAGNRPSGTTALLEDIAVPVEGLDETCRELTRLFGEYDYEDSVIFGHAKDGNIHFMLNERFERPESLARYEAFTEEMIALVLGHGGTLKAEHGTGRIMAPFVRRQYGDELYEVMQEVKRLVDPAGLLNPGVLLNEDPAGHVSNLKTAPTVESEVDRCVECGYCEPVCPSRDITLTPRERIVLRRELADAEASGDDELVAELRREYSYDGVQTCAVDGMCQTACPVLINTGDLVRRLRGENQNRVMQAAWKAAAQHWDVVSKAGGAAMTVADAMPAVLPKAATAAGRALLGADVVPEYSVDLPAGGAQRRPIEASDAVAVYFSSCTNTMFGPVGKNGVSESFLELCARAGVVVATPDDIPSLCCGTPWKSKGLTDGYDVMKGQVTASLLRATRDGELPVVCDASSCTEGLRILLESAQGSGIRVMDAVEFVDAAVLPRLPAGKKIPSVTLHPTCSSVHLGLESALKRVSAAAAEEVIVPDEWGCCAFAGDRGMLHPELTASATARQAAQAIDADTVAYASLNRTCELGMTRATGREYEHILQTLARSLSATDTE